MQTAATFSELSILLNRWTRRVRLHAALTWALRGMVGGLAIGLGMSLVARFGPLWDVRQLVIYGGSAVLAGCGLAALPAYFWPRSPLAVARRLDRRLGLAERTSTAFELAQGRLAAPPTLRQQQLRDAIRNARQVDSKRQLPFRLDRVELMAALLILAALAISLALPNEQLRVLTQQRAVAEAIEQQVAQIEALREEIRNDEALTDVQREQLLRPLEEALQTLQGGDLTQEQAVSALNAAQQPLQALANPQSLQQQLSDLQQVGEGLAQNGATAEVGQALQNTDLPSAAEALRNMDVAALTADEREALGEQLDAAANSLSEANPDLAADLAAAAEALRRGDTAAAEAALEQAADALDQLASQAAQSQTALQTAQRLEQFERAIAQAGQQSQPGRANQAGQPNNQAGQPGQGQAPAAGGGQPQGGPGQGPGQPQQGGQSGGQQSGSGFGEGLVEAQGGQAGTQPIEQSALGDGGERGYEPIYAPQRLGGQGGPQVQLEGQGDPGDEIIAERDTNPTEEGEVLVPYNRVFAEYNAAAHEAVEAGQVPVGLRSVVRDYFSALQPP